ncbi:metallophosphoesterase [Desulforamulus putei]|uniref:metallophosphoesterase n=1 Tax=Desulforamulus putei TaxID=74701 RepID=UPI002FDE8923
MRLWFYLILIIYTFLNWLIGRQLYELLKTNKIAFWVVFLVLAYSPVLGRLVYKGFEPIGNYWMVFFYYATFVAVLGLLVKNKPFITGCYLLIFLVILYGSVNANKIKVQRYEIAIPKLATDLRIVMLSDIHIDNAKPEGYVEKMVREINLLNPDLVVLPGDIFDDKDIHVLSKEREALKNIKAKYGVYGVLGNHEYYTGNLNESLKIFKEANITILRDEVVEIAGIYLVGREDASRKRKNLASLLEGVHKEKPIILLDHQPVALEEAKIAGVDLQLSGHTHRGQFFPNQLITKRLYEVDYGYLAKEQLQVIVSSGYGTWGPPVRIGTQSEIVDIQVKFKK